MNFKVNPTLDLTGTSLKGYIDTSYEKLVSTFSEPEDGSSDGKTRVEWHVEFEDGTVANIYDWKCSEPIEQVETWNIGGRSPAAVNRVAQVLGGIIHARTWPNGLVY